MPTHHIPKSAVIGIFLLLLTLTNAAGSVTTEIVLTSYTSYLLFLTILILAGRIKYTHPIFVLAIGAFSIIVSNFSGAQYLYIILPALIISIIAKKYSQERLTTGSIVYLACINLVCLALTAYTIHEHGLTAGLVRTELFRDPNFYASFFLVLGFPLLLGRRTSKIIALTISGIVIYLTLSRAFLIGLTFQIAALLAIQHRQYHVTRAACILIAILSITFPFITTFLFSTEIHNYSIGAERMLQFNDESNFGRNQQIIKSFEYIFDNNLLFNGIQESLLPQKPHNWFWLIAIRFGFLSAVAFLLLIFIIILRTPIRLAVICASAALSTGFLDFLPLVTILYSTLAYYIAAGQFPKK